MSLGWGWRIMIVNTKVREMCKVEQRGETRSLVYGIRIR
jgi:hypothetical protein